MTVFIDSNIPMYVAGSDHPNKGPATRFLDRVRTGEVEACTSAEVLQEILYRYSSIRRMDLATHVYSLFVQICPTVLPVTLADTDRALEIAEEGLGIGVRDCVHAAVMLNHGVSSIATFDRGFDRIEKIERLDLNG